MQKLTFNIDNKNYQFTSSVKNRLENLSKFSEKSLEWLMMEHYQFSSRNTGFLASATAITKQFKEQGVSEELQRNFDEEKNHASIYKKSLMEIGTNVNTRIEFHPTRIFFEEIEKLIASCPSTTLGAMYATETAAIFEHEVFWEISKEVISRRGLEWEKSRLKKFHDMHLNGVEQGHKDGLGMFVDFKEENLHSKQIDKKLIDKNKIELGAHQAIGAMISWWEAMLAEAGTM